MGAGDGPSHDRVPFHRMKGVPLPLTIQVGMRCFSPLGMGMEGDVKGGGREWGGWGGARCDTHWVNGG